MKPRIFKIAVAAAFLLLEAASVNAKTVRMFSTSCTGPLTMVCDSIDYRADLTRVYGRLTGRPHTSNRIDGIVLVSGGKTFVSTDIDGVDLKRWFQWEDEGAIPVEIDFAPMSPCREAVVKAAGPRGESQWKLRAINKK
ncbi:MAG: hypothetical protein K2I18_02045 [Paramuribaculum sp.]|nr:hypothetical protein [Paramuribaculum sp.]